MMVEHMNSCGETNAKHWIFHMIETLPHDQFSRLAVTLWAIWTSRGKAIHEDIFYSPLSTFGFVNSFLKELNVLNDTAARAKVQCHNVREKPTWIPPPTAIPKINVDAAVEDRHENN
jgi:hypothetical protein